MKTRILFVTLIAVILLPLPHTVSRSVAATPVNPDASPEARALLNFIHAMYGKKTLSGQMWAPWGIDEIKTVQEITGKLPAIRGQDYIHERANKRENKLAIEWWKAGGIATIMWHWAAPSKGEGYNQSKMTIDIDRCFEPGTAEHTAMWNDLERIADHLTELRDANVPVLWRPMHEFDGGWFWYGKGGSQRFIRLWRTMFDYFVKERKLNNLIWVLCHSGRPKADWNPGKDYYDLAGPDTYGKGIQESLFNTAEAIHGDTIPIAYHECGTIPDPDESFERDVTWSWWMLWHTGHLTKHNRDALIRAYNHKLILTRDELPNIMDYLEGAIGLPPAKPKATTAKPETRNDGMIADKPLFRDPVYDGAADPVLCFNHTEKKWFMFYTNRRANVPDTVGVSWVHGTPIGIAESSDGGATWKYRTTARIDYKKGKDTYWAPDVIEHNCTYHMYLTYVPGIFTDWNASRDILHLTSKNLLEWEYQSTLRLSSDRVIDASVKQLPDGTWRMWYNNEIDNKSIYYADSKDLYVWQDKGKAVRARGEGPKIFHWKGHVWMVVDVWRGLSVYRSKDALNWQLQKDNLLEKPGKGTDDQVKGGHPDVVVSGDRAYLFYFTHPGRRGPDANKDTYEQRRSSIQVVELEFKDGWLTCERDKPTRILLNRGLSVDIIE